MKVSPPVDISPPVDLPPSVDICPPVDLCRASWIVRLSAWQTCSQVNLLLYNNECELRGQDFSPADKTITGGKT